MRGMRLVPITMVLAAFLFGVKVFDLWRAVPPVVDELGVHAAMAQAAPAATPAAPAPAAPAAPAAPPQAAAPAGGLPAPGTGQAAFTAAELDMLQNLKQRREELDNRERELDLRANLLVVSQKRIDDRIVELQKVQSTIDALLVKYDAQEEAQIQKFVKVYETMKPKDAATIFNTLDMKVMLELAQRIKERTMAPILAAMEPTPAKALTIELATRRALPPTGK